MTDPFGNFDYRDVANEYRDVAFHDDASEFHSYPTRMAEPVQQPPDDDGMMHTMEAFHWRKKE